MLDPRKWLTNALSKGSLLAAAGSMATGAVMASKRNKYKTMDPLVEQLNAYDIGRAAGKLIQGWLQMKYPAFDAKRFTKLLDGLIQDADEGDDSIMDRARTRFLVSKAMFYMEGFQLKSPRYEQYQEDACKLLHRHPNWRQVSRKDVFLGKPFEPESLIGATHRLLVLTLQSNADTNALRRYLRDVGEDLECRDGVDQMQRLIALIFEVDEEEAFLAIVRGWFESYREFEINRSRRQQTIINTSLTAATGGLPGMLGMNAMGRVWKRIRTPKPKV